MIVLMTRRMNLNRAFICTTFIQTGQSDQKFWLLVQAVIVPTLEYQLYDRGREIILGESLLSVM